jgi:hypothetical protein
MAAACRPPVAPGGDQDFAVGVVVESVVALLLSGDGLAEAANAVQPGIDVVAVMNCLDGGFLDRGRDRRVADTLREIDAADGVAGEAHGANFRLDGGGGEVAEGESRRCGWGGGHRRSLLIHLN